MYTIQPLKIGECHTEQGPKMFYLEDWDKTYSTYFYFWYIEGNNTRILIDVGFNLDESKAIMPTMIQKPEWRPAERLKQIGVDPESIEHIIVTERSFFSLKDNGIIEQLDLPTQYVFSYIYEKKMRQKMEQLKVTVEKEKKAILREGEKEGRQVGLIEGEEQGLKKLARTLLQCLYCLSIPTFTDMFYSLAS